MDGFWGAEDVGWVEAGWSAQAALDVVWWPDGAREWPWDRRLAWWTAAQSQGPTAGQVVAVTSVLRGTDDAQAREWLLADWGPEVLHATDGDAVIQELRAWGQRLTGEQQQQQSDMTGTWEQNQPDPDVQGQGLSDTAGSWGHGQSDTGVWG